MYTIRFQDGTEYGGLEKTGAGVYSSAERLPLEYGRIYRNVTVSGDEGEAEGNAFYDYVRIDGPVRCPMENTEWDIFLSMNGTDEARRLKLEGDTAYIAMMTGVDLDE